MYEIGLSITKPYHDLFSFDSRKVKCLGLIKDLVVILTQLPSKSLIMDIVMVDIPPKFGLLLSQSWSKILGGTLQMDLTYATIPMFRGETKVWKLRDSFMFFELSYIPRDLNHLADSLSVSVRLFVHPLPRRLRYDVQVKYITSLPDNVKFWSVFENDEELSKFL